MPKFKVEAGNTAFCSDTDGVLYSKDGTTLYAVPMNVTLTNGTYTINDNVTKILLNAFRYISGLKKLVFPKNLKTIETGYPTIAPWNQVEEFAITSGGTTKFKVIDGVLFNDTELSIYPNRKSTTAYTLPDGIISVASYAIFAANKLTSIDLNQATTLALSSLYSDNSLKTITLPKNIKKDGLTEGCFEDCLNVTEYKVPTENTDFVADDGIVFSKDKSTLYFYPPAKVGAAYTIPSTVTTVAARAFQGAKNLTEITIPISVSTVKDMAFREMYKLTKVTFKEPSVLKKLGTNAFWMCGALKEITLPKSLTSINDVFRDCTALEVIHVPNGSNLTTINGGAFATNKNLTTFDFQGSCALTQIGTSAFANLTKLKSFNFPKSITNIWYNVFSGCSNLTSVTFDSNSDIKLLGHGAFADCALTSINLPSKVETIEREAFRNCKVLTTVNVSSNTTYISPEAFKYCENLTDINVDKKNTVYSSVDGILLTHDKKTLVLFPEGKANSKFTLLPPSITKIGDYAFYDCTKLENVTLPNLVTSIGKRAFGLCKNLNTITFLCDQMPDPAQIDQTANFMSIDDGTNVADDMFKNINIYVRKSLVGQYMAQDYYKKFKSIGTSFTDGKEEYIPLSATDVDLLSTQTTDYTYVLPTTTSDGKYNVSLVGDYAFQNVGNAVHEVVVRSNVEYLGAKTFMTDITNNKSTISNVFFIESNPTKEMLSTTRFELDETGSNYNEFANTTKVYVKKSALNTYKKAWAKKVYDTSTGQNKTSSFDFTDQLDYRIPDVAIANKYGTFAREFDTDFSDYMSVNGNSRVAAFVAGSGILRGSGDYEATTYHVRMTSIDVNGGYSSYSYVPANTGVLLKVLDADKTGKNFYYTIGEHDQQTYTVTDNIMHGVTVNSASMDASSTSPVYVMQGGIFRKATSPITSFPVHKAYMKTSGLPAGAKLVIDFDDSLTSGINTLDTEGKHEDTYYNLNGQRVSSPSKGVYIHMGRKVIIK